MLPVVLVAYLILAVGAIVLGVVSGAVARVILRLPGDRRWVDALLGMAGMIIPAVWNGFTDSVIAVLDLETHIKGRIDQYVAVMAMTALVLPSLGQLLRFAVRKADRT